MWQNVYFFIFTWLRSVQNWIYRFIRHKHQQYTHTRSQRHKNMKMCWKSKNILQKIMVNLFLFQSLLLTMCICVCVYGCVHSTQHIYLCVFHNFIRCRFEINTQNMACEFIRNVHACLQAAYFLCVFCVGSVAYNSIHFGTYAYTHTHAQTQNVFNKFSERECVLCVRVAVYPWIDVNIGRVAEYTFFALSA